MPRRVDPAAERAAILDAALPLVVEQGPAGVRMRALAAAAGVSTGKLYHYFPDKRAMMEALLPHVGARDVAAARSLLLGTEDRAAALRLLADFVEAQAPRLQDTLLLALDHHRLHPGEEATRDALRLYRRALTEDLGADDEVLFSVLIGMLVRRLLAPEDVDLAAHRAFIMGVRTC
jgi:AcrR family transcriptional regulator